jgi:hypothetical protein
MMTNETADRIKGLAASMRATAHAGDVYSGKTLISKSNALRYADDFEALLSALDEAVSGWNEESEKLTDETERANAAEFLLALMAAAAETTYRTGFRDAERVTDERHIDYLRGNTIAGIAAAMQAPDADLTARVETLQARVGELEGALKPLLSCLDDIETYQRRPERGDWGVECAWPHKAEAVPTRTPQVSHEFREAKQNNPSPTTGADQ